MTGRAQTRIDEAINWHLQTQDQDFSNWDAFTAWLEQSPENSSAYDEVALADLEFGDLKARAGRPLLHVQEPVAVSKRRRVMGLRWAAAAAIPLAAVVTFLSSQTSSNAVRTAAGERKTLELRDGSTIQLNGDTEVVLDQENIRFAEVRRGEALFTVVHDSAAPFTVRAGERTLVDIGTVFNVVHGKGAIEVSVAEGAVIFQPGKENIRLDPGDKLVAKPRSAAAITRIAPEAVTDWTTGRLVFEDATLVEVAAELSRSAGATVQVDPDMAGRRFTGIIQLDGGTSTVMQRVSALSGTRLEQTGSGWAIRPARRDGR